MRSPLSRTCRAAVFAAVAVGVSATGHAVVSAHQVPLAGVAAGFAAVLLTVMVAAGRERGYWIILGWMGWSQVALHLIFALAQAFVDPVTGASAHHAALAGADPGPGGHGGPSADPGAGSGMLVWHTVSALLSSWWLRQGEAAATALARYVRAVLFPPLPRVSAWRPTRSLVPRVRVPRSIRVHTRVLRHAVVVRGPPLSPSLP